MPKFNREEFGNRLRKFRKQKGLSQENLANVIGKNATTIGRFESGKLIPNAEEIYLLCNELGIEEYQLFNSFDKVIHKSEVRIPLEQINYMFTILVTTLLLGNLINVNL